MSPESTPHSLGPTARLRLLVAVPFGVVAGVAIGVLSAWDVAPLAGWDIAAAVLIVWTWVTVAGRDAHQTATHALRDDPSVGWTDVLVLSGCVASLAGVVLVFLHVGGQGAALIGRTGLAVGSVVVSWALVHTIFTLHYARLYYTGPDGDVNFNQDEPPNYLDFAYLAFTIGMTYQVSDTDLKTSAIRHTALRHALLSYLLGAVIIAGTINLIAGLTK